MKKLFSISLFLIATSLFVVSCKETDENNQSQRTDTITQSEKGSHTNCDEVHWGYNEGEETPDHWKDLCSGFSACGGKSQSPVNIMTENSNGNAQLNALTLNYDSATVDIINNGHTVQFNIHENNSLTIDGKEYKLLQFHYHTSSEHTVNGDHYPIEIHFVHKYSDDDYAVLGIFFEEGESNPFFTDYLSDFPKTKDANFKTDNVFNLVSLIPENMSYYHYNGSLTTPPCSEVVNWYLLKTPIKASKEQIEQLSNILNHNFRPVMPLNGREVDSFEE